MEPKLQQAIVATRAGRTDIAQHLLTQLITEQPDNSNAWFLLSYLVDSPDRQARYLNKVLQIDPDHVKAKQRLAVMPDAPVPAPVIQSEISGVSVKTPERINETPREIVITPSTPILDEVVVDNAANTSAAENKLPEWLQDLDKVKLGEQTKNKEVDQEWLKSPGVPKREGTPSNPNQKIQPSSVGKSTGAQSSGDSWLIRILLLLVIIAFIVLGFLVLLIFI